MDLDFNDAKRGFVEEVRGFILVNLTPGMARATALTPSASSDPAIGASVPQIAAVTGHSLKDVEAILDAHYLGRDIQLAEAAMLKLEARTKL